MLIGHASISENGTTKGAKGDQNGKEVCTRGFYSKPWNCHIRPIDRTRANYIADFIVDACNNDNIGYSQSDRNSLLHECLKNGYDASSVGVCNCDCSSLVVCALISAGYDGSYLYNGNCATTSSLVRALQKIGGFEITYDSKYANNESLMMRGDILLKEGSHVAVCIGASSTSHTIQKIKDIFLMDLKRLQEAIKADGISNFPKYGCDGKYGMECDSVLYSFNVRKYSKYTNVVKLIQEFLCIKVDGIFGDETYSNVIAYQYLQGLKADGIVGHDTFNKMLGR